METTTLSEAQLAEIARAIGRPVVGAEYVTSGAASHVHRIVCDRFSLIAKTSKVDKPDLFACEADALERLAGTQTVPVPEVLGHTATYLLLEDLGAEAEDGAADWATFGAQVGALHQVRGDAFGYDHDNYIGIWDQANPWTENWVDFFFQNRVLCFLDSGKNREVLTREDRDGILRLMEGVRDQIPDQPPSLCHGDLWWRNAFRKADGRVYALDPAIHYGLPEADLAMTQMYALFPDAFYDGYRTAHPLLPDWKERLPLYQLKEILLMIAQFEHAESLALLRALIERYG